jgi:hypothetical protein
MGSSEEEYDSECDEEGLSKSTSPGDIINYDIIIHPVIIEELKRIEKRITELADGDDEFISNIVEYSLLICKNQGIFRENINELIRDKYPNMHIDLKLEGKEELFKLVFDLTEIIIGQHQLTKDYFVVNTTPEKRSEGWPIWAKYVKQFREVLEPEIIKIFYDSDDNNEEECSILGNMNEHSNNMEM